MPLIPQQDILVITGPYKPARGGSFEGAAVEKLRAALEGYPPCRIITFHISGSMHAVILTAVIETV